MHHTLKYSSLAVVCLGWLLTVTAILWQSVVWHTHISIVFFGLISVPYVLLGFVVCRARTKVSQVITLFGAFIIFTLAVLAYSYSFFSYITVYAAITGFSNVAVYQTFFGLIAWLFTWICQRKQHSDEKHVA